MTDLEKGHKTSKSAEPTERSPLVNAQKAAPASWSSWWNYQTTAQYRFAITFSLQTTAWVLLVISPSLATADGRKWFASQGFNIAYLVCNFLFSMGRSFGATIQNILAGFQGIFQACFVIWIMNGVYPQGYTGTKDTDDAWYTGMFVTVLFFSFYMCLNVDGGVRFWALYTYVPFAMAYLNKNVTSGFSEGWNVNIKGSAWNSLLLYAVGCIPAIISCLFPKRICAMDALKDGMQDIIDSNFMLQERLIMYFCRAAPAMEVNDLVGDITVIHAKIAFARTNHDSAYFECFNLGTTGIALRMMEEMLNTMGWMNWVLESLIAITKREEFMQNHIQIMEEVKNQCLELARSTHNLCSKMKNATCEGAVSDKTAEEVHIAGQEAINNATTLINTMEKVCSQRWNSQKINPKATTEQVFVYKLCRIAKIIAVHAQGFCQRKEKIREERRAGLTDLWNYWKAPYVTTTKSDVRWGLTNLLSLILSFYIGYIGWSPECLAHQQEHPGATSKGKISCLVHPFNANPCCLIIMLMAKTNIGAALQSGLDKICAVVLAMVAGQMAWQFLGSCDAMHRLWTGMFVFAYVSLWMYVAYSSSGTFSSLGTRLAAIGAMDVLAACSPDFLNDTVYSNKYHKVSDYCLGLGIMLTIDWMFSDKASSVKAKEAILNSMNDFSEFYSHYFQIEETKKGERKFHGMPTIYDQTNKKLVVDRLQGIMDAVAGAASEGDAAGMEPVLWHKPWGQVLFRDITNCVMIPLKYIRTICFIVGDDVEADMVSQCLKQSPSFKKMTAYIFELYDYTRDLAEILLMMQNKTDKGTPEERWKLCLKQEPFKSSFDDRDKVIAEFNRLLNKPEFSKDDLCEEFRALQQWLDVPVTQKLSMRLTAIVETLESMLSHWVSDLCSVVREAV